MLLMEVQHFCRASVHGTREKKHESLDRPNSLLPVNSVNNVPNALCSKQTVDAVLPIVMIGAPP
jgi:hypothetical protein